MKRIFLPALLVFASCFSSCGNEGKPKNKDSASDTVIPKLPDSSAQAAAYVCPCGPECGTGDAPGKCASCGIEMKENKR